MIVVDASVAVKWAVEETGRMQALRLLDGTHDLAAPDLIFVEVANVLRRKGKAGEVTVDQARRAVEATEMTLSSVLPALELWRDATAIAESLDHAVHDCFYLAAALDRGMLVTADEKFARKCRNGRYGASVRSLADLDDLTDPPHDPISSDLLEEVARLSALTMQTFDTLREHAEGQVVGALKIVPVGSYMPGFESPAYLKLARLLEGVSPEQLGDLVALGWLGRSYHGPGDWVRLRQRARQMAAEGLGQHRRYFIAQLPFVASGLEKLRAIASP